MKRTPRLHVARPRHPLTGRQITIRARTAAELASLVYRVESMRNELRHDLVTPDEVDRKLRRLQHGPVSLERAAVAYMTRAIAKNTRRRVASFVKSNPELVRLELDELDGARLARWTDSLRATDQPSTIGQKWRTMRAIVRYATELGWIARVPWGTWRPVVRGGIVREREAARTIAELVALVDAARELDDERATHALPWRPFGSLSQLEAKIATKSLLGLRQGELAGLRWSDFDRDRLSVTIGRQWDDEPTKTPGSSTRLLAPSELFDVLDVHRARLERVNLYDAAGPVFPDLTTSTALRPRAYTSGECLTRRDLRAVVLRAGLPHPSRWSPHSLRDTFVTLEARAHDDLKDVQPRSRHKRIASLLRYLRSLQREPAAPGFTLPPAQRSPPALPPHKK